MKKLTTGTLKEKKKNRSKISLQMYFIGFTCDIN